MQTTKIISLTTSLSLLFFTLGSFAHTYTYYAKLVLHNTSLSDSIGYTVTVASDETHVSSSGGVISPADQSPATIQFSRIYHTKYYRKVPEATITIFNNATPQYICKIILTKYVDEEVNNEFIIPANCVGLDVMSPQPGTYHQKSISVYLKTDASVLKKRINFKAKNI